MSETEQIKALLQRCTPAQREEIFRHLREELTLHPLEAKLHTRAEVILEAIDRAGGLTLRMLRGVIAEAAFGVEVVGRLQGWRDTTPAGHRPYDFRLEERKGAVTVQVKLQRSRENRPMLAPEANRSFPPDMYVVETQKTRAGTDRKTRGSTRPYRFGEFDLLAVSMQPSTNRWDVFLYTVADWLVARQENPAEMLKFQPVPAAPNDDWTDSFDTVVKWLRAKVKKRIRAE
jgi:hypothetical protein